MRFNGWQRAWVVLSVVWIAATSSVAITSRCSEEQRYHDLFNELIRYLIAQSTDLRGHTTVSVRAAYSDMSDRQLVEATHDKYLNKHPAYRYGFSEIDAKHSPGTASTLTPNLQRGLAALGVPLALYLLGVAVAWVRAGFRRT
jgi:hypothetical protein